MPLFCRDCKDKIDDLNYFHVHNELFLSVCKKRDVICIRCLETRLGRELIENDFTNTPTNLTISFYRNYKNVIKSIIDKFPNIINDELYINGKNKQGEQNDNQNEISNPSSRT